MKPKIPRATFEQGPPGRAAELSADRQAKSGAPEPGDMYLAPTRGAAIVEWAAVQPHPDNDGVLYFVPVDDFPLVGRCDVVVSRRAMGRRLILRCGEGLWAQGGHFDAHLWVGRIDPEYIQAARETLAKIVRASLEGSAARLENEADPEYQDWMDEVGVARDALEEWLADAGCIVRLRDFRDRRPDFAGESVAYTLAADSGGLLATFADAAEQAGGAQPQFRRVVGDWPGDLYLQADVDGVAILWHGTRARPPVLHVRGPRRRWRPVRWQRETKRRGWATSTMPWDNGKVTLRIGSAPGQLLSVRQ